MKKTIALMISLVLTMSATNAVYGTGYSDIKTDNWAYEAVNAMSGKAIIKGYPNGSFKPNNTVTYGEFIKMALIAGTGEDVGNSATGNWATGYYNKALELKYYTAHDIDPSQLGNQITRGDMALIISAILGDVTIENYDAIQKGITDVDYQTEHEYDITKAYATGVLTGYTDNTFKPDKTLTRAESAMVIYRLVDESKRELPGGEENKNVGKVEDIVKNADSFISSGNGTIDEDLAAATTYTIETDSSKYEMTLHENRGTKWIDIKKPTGLGWIYLMKDGSVVEFMQTTPSVDGSKQASFKSDITQMDYIVSVTSDKTMLLIANPFQK